MRWTLTFCRAAGECDAAIVLLLYRARCAVLLEGIGCTCLRIALPILLEAESTWMLPVLRVWIPGTGLAGNRKLEPSLTSAG